jgi:serine/threonine protein kinase
VPSRGPLNPGDVLDAKRSGSKIIIERYVAEGGQGYVYEARRNDEPVAVKWYKPSYYPRNDKRLPERLNHLIDLWEQRETENLRNFPFWRFLWPSDIVVRQGVEPFGYVMRWKEDKFAEFDRVFHRQVEPESFRLLISAGIELVDGYWHLHSRGYCYYDVSGGNAAMDCQTGEIRICDCDNIDQNEIPGAILGTGKYMAPEILRGEVVLPTQQTDFWSLAVLLFSLFFRNHPLQGRNSDLQLETRETIKQYYGINPLYIFDPMDSSNAPDPERHETAVLHRAIYPKFLLKLFDRAFTEGLRDPEHGRIMETEWRGNLVKLRDSIMLCPHCKAKSEEVENFFDPDTSGRQRCWACGRELPRPRLLKLGGVHVVVSDGLRLFPHHLDPDPRRRWDFSQALACVSRNPKRPDEIGLKNLGSEPWRAKSADGNEAIVEPQRSVRLDPKMRIYFGSTRGVVI